MSTVTTGLSGGISSGVWTDVKANNQTGFRIGSSGQQVAQAQDFGDSILMSTSKQNVVGSKQLWTGGGSFFASVTGATGGGGGAGGGKTKVYAKSGGDGGDGGDTPTRTIVYPSQTETLPITSMSFSNGSGGNRGRGGEYGYSSGRNGENGNNATASTVSIVYSDASTSYTKNLTISGSGGAEGGNKGTGSGSGQRGDNGTNVSGAVITFGQTGNTGGFQNVSSQTIIEGGTGGEGRRSNSGNNGISGVDGSHVVYYLIGSTGLHNRL